jgi:hypothetical protein
MTPRPPICIKNKITICPNVLQFETVVTVTRPVTQTDVVDVNNASIKEVVLPDAELIGRLNNIVPIIIKIRKLIKTICVVDNLNFV